MSQIASLPGRWYRFSSVTWKPLTGKAAAADSEFAFAVLGAAAVRPSKLLSRRVAVLGGPVVPPANQLFLQRCDCMENRVMDEEQRDGIQQCGVTAG